MNCIGRDKIVLLGMFGRMRVAGAVWQAAHYLVGLERLGYEAYYIEAHGCMPWAFLDNEVAEAEFIDSVMRRFDMGDRWAFHARNGSGAYYGMSEPQVKRLYRSAAAILNLHGGTVPTPEQSSTGRLVYVDTDPGNLQFELHEETAFTLEVLGQHCAFFTFAENYGRDDCKLPVSERFSFKPTRQPVVMDFWNRQAGERAEFTTIGNWQQLRRVVEFNGEEYFWSKHFEFLKFLDLPGRTAQPFELALSSCDEDATALLTRNGWRVLDAFSFSHDLDAYRTYIADSRGEFTVAKDQNVRLRTGWFSDRSATYLAAGRPVITQETGFSNTLPTGEGLFGFLTMDEILSAVDAINGSYERHRRAATSIARENFSHDVVLSRMLSEIGVARRVMRTAEHFTPEVSVVGRLSGTGGIETAARRYLHALNTAGLRTRAVDLPDGGMKRSTERGEEGSINLLCFDLPSYFAARSSLGEDFFRDRYNIGIWPWELPAFPSSWCDRFAYHDEVWAPSGFIASVLAPISPVPVVRIPHVLVSEMTGSRTAGRKKIEAADDEFVFAFVFNSFSSYARKNPLAVIDAFKKAFGPGEPARLVIKCAHADFDRSGFAEMKFRAQGRRISICGEDWSAQEIADLTAGCDCYVSLHRAEGVGLTIGDAMAAGKPVIATGWSGNMDFMNVSNSFPVEYQLVELEDRVTCYPKGSRWAEPSVEHAAELMRFVFDHPEDAAHRGELARQEIASNFSDEAVARLLKERIHLISNRDRFREMKERLAGMVEDAPAFVEAFSDLGPYVPSEHLSYLKLKSTLRGAVREHVPRNAVLAVVSKGDADLLQLHEGSACHFPSDPSGAYAGYYPEDSAAAIREVKTLQAEEGHFLLFPRTAFWWLEHYSELNDYLHQECRLTHSDEFCRIFEIPSTGEKQWEVA